VSRKEFSLIFGDAQLYSFRLYHIRCPLNPQHYVNGMAIYDDAKSKPNGLPVARDNGRAPTLSLTTQDIEGAVPGWKPKHTNGGIPEEKRRHFRNTNFIGDVQGAQVRLACLVRVLHPLTSRRSQADSHRHGIVTNRNIDPLNPAYQSLDGL
jgi:hypothetical protein